MWPFEKTTWMKPFFDDQNTRPYENPPSNVSDIDSELRYYPMIQGIDCFEI
jgi:hypothetical protein